MKILEKLFKKSASEAHMPVPAEYREDYQKFMERKGESDRINTPQRSHEEKKEDPLDMSVFDPLSNIPNNPMPEPLTPIQRHETQNSSEHQTLSLESLNERLTKLETILKEKGYI